jgi:Arc/MetJ-type ribon-helix-helix transcriptional regulator
VAGCIREPCSSENGLRHTLLNARNGAQLDSCSREPYAGKHGSKLTQDQEAFICQAIESGRFHRKEEAVLEALSLWEERERKREEFLVTLNDAKASLARGEGRTITQESMRELAGDVKRRGLTRLTAEQQASR